MVFHLGKNDIIILNNCFVDYIMKELVNYNG